MIMLKPGRRLCCLPPLLYQGITMLAENGISRHALDLVPRDQRSYRIMVKDQVRIVSDAYQYLNQREPYYFAYSVWVLANQAGGKQSPAVGPPGEVNVGG
jgi:hypothetical protein